MNRQLDVLFVSPDSSFQAYQALSKDFSAIEPPTWALLLAQSCRAKGFGVGILDCGAERLSAEDSVKRIAEANPRLVCVVVYGQNPNSGTTNMIGATALCRLLKQQHPGYPICFVGSHTSALPLEVLALDCVDIRPAQRRRLCPPQPATDRPARRPGQDQGHRLQAGWRPCPEPARARRAAGVDGC